MNARLATSVLVSGLMRKAQGEGGFAAILAKGDANAGAAIVLLSERGEARALLEKILQPDGDYSWQDIGLGSEGAAEEARKQIERRRKFDPDLWVVELDVPSWERFAAEINQTN
jgi:hypothetical protein